MENTNLTPEQPSNQSRETYSNQDQKPSGNSNSKPIIIGLAILLIASVGFNIYQAQDKKQAVELITVDLKDEEQAKIQLQEQLDILSDEHEVTKKDLNIRDSILSKRDAEIFDKQKEIQSILSKKNVSESELKKAQRMITSLNGEIARFKEEIKVLQTKNDSLVVVTNTLSTEKEDFSNKLVVEKEKATEQENRIRSTFSISNYKLSGVKVKNSGKEVETDKAKRIDKLRVSFDLDPNQYAESGNNEIYVAIYKPDGKLGKFKDASYGEIETWSMGKVQYSDKVQFYYTKGTKQNISFDWEEYEFPKGNYRIDIYQNGFKIGQKSLDLR